MATGELNAGTLGLGFSDMVGVYTNDLRSGRVFAGRRLAEYFNIPPDAARAGLPFDVFLPAVVPQDRDVLRFTHAALVTGTECTATYRVASRSHGVRRVLDVGACYRGNDGSPRVLTGYIVDVTEKHPDVSRQRVRELLAQARDAAHDSGLTSTSYLIEALAMGLPERDG